MFLIPRVLHVGFDLRKIILVIIIYQEKTEINIYLFGSP